MSGIAGILCADFEMPVGAAAERMAALMVHRGPHGRRVWRGRGVALAHLALHTTAESRGESLPLELDPGGPMITADARIDNRSELLEALGLEPRAGAPVGDAELVLRAYERWGERCLARLDGDFAFAIWDPARARLFCARDRFGVRPLFHARTKGCFAFASEVKALLGLEGVSRSVDELRIAYFLENIPGEQDHTVFRDVRRLPPAHSLTATAEEQRVERYFSLDPKRELPRERPEAHVEHFRELFTAAVTARIRTDLPLGTMLSGGIDSSSITCVARELGARADAAPLHVFSVVFDDVPESNEREYIEAVLAGGEQVSHLIRGDRLAPYAEWDAVVRAMDQPCYGANLYLHRAMYEAARAQGIGVMLDGVAGDIVVDYGLDRFLELALRGRFLELRAELRRFAARVHGRPRVVFQRCVRAPLVSTLRTHAPRPLRRLWDAVRRARGQDPDGLPGLAHPELARRVDLRARIRALDRSLEARPRTARGAAHHLNLVDGLMFNALGTIESLAASFGLEPRFPFLDRRLVEFCLALPADLRLRDGYNRFVIRQALEGLPEIVRWRDWKADLGHALAHGLATRERERIDGLVGEDRARLEPYVDLPTVEALRERFLVSPSTEGLFDLCKLVDLAAWLRFQELRGEHPPQADDELVH